METAPIGCVPIVWNNADLLDLAPETPAATVLDEIARIGFQGVQFGRGFPEGDQLRTELAARGLRFAELYCALDADERGLRDGAATAARRDLERLVAAGGEVLVVALDRSPARDAWSGRVAQGAPQWSDRAFERLAALLAALAEEAPPGVRVAFHPHAGTWIEAPSEVEALASRLTEAGAGLCLDVGHYLAGGGDPVAAIGRYRELITHVHVKDVDPAVLSRLQAGQIHGFGAAVQERIFTEAGRGALDLVGVLSGLDTVGYAGWLMVEQDSSWLPPSEAAALSLRAIHDARRLVTESGVA